MWSLVHPSLTQCTCMEYDLQPLLSQSSPPPLLLKYTLFSRNTQVNVYISSVIYMQFYYALKDIEHMNSVYINRHYGRKTEFCLAMYITFITICMWCFSKGMGLGQILLVNLIINLNVNVLLQIWIGYLCQYTIRQSSIDHVNFCIKGLVFSSLNHNRFK